MWLFIALVGTADAYETDQLTLRDDELADALPFADAEMDRVLADAVDATNERLMCDASPERTQKVLAHEIHVRTATEVPLWSKGVFRSPGYGRYQAALETDPSVERHEFLERVDIYADLSAMESLILDVAGTCSTIRLAGRSIGTDKIDHFFGEGFDYFRKSRQGRDPDRAIRWGTTTERTIYGLLTSKTFSFADLRANYDGYVFYAGLLEPGSVVELDDDGCAVQTRGWDWTEWVDDDWDEVLNPSVYTPVVQRGITRRLEDQRDGVCESYAVWGDSSYDGRMRALDPRPPYVLGRVPERIDPFALAALCEEDTTVAAGSP